MLRVYRGEFLYIGGKNVKLHGCYGQDARELFWYISKSCFAKDIPMYIRALFSIAKMINNKCCSVDELAKKV